MCMHTSMYIQWHALQQSKFISMQGGRQRNMRLYVAAERIYTTHGYLFKTEFAETYSVFWSRSKHGPASHRIASHRPLSRHGAWRGTRSSTQGAVRVSRNVPFPVAREKNNLIYWTELNWRSPSFLSSDCIRGSYLSVNLPNHICRAVVFVRTLGAF
jgi:hypothetical protein